MGLFKKRRDPITARAQSLNAEIASLRAQIRQLNTQIQTAESQPKLRSTALPASAPPPPPPPRAPEPVFEPVDHQRVQSPETGDTPAHFNELGARKFDLVAVWKKLLHHLKGPPTSNPKLVSYLAAGTIQGLRPLRYEKRVARNRLLGLAILLAVVLYILIYVIMRR